MMKCLSSKDHFLSHGLVNCSSQGVSKITGLTSKKINDLLDYSAEPELNHRDNLVLL